MWKHNEDGGNWTRSVTSFQRKKEKRKMKLTRPYDLSLDEIDVVMFM